MSCHVQFPEASDRREEFVGPENFAFVIVCSDLVRTFHWHNHLQHLMSVRRIQTLTFILHKMNTQCSPISDRKQVPAFFVTWATPYLRHFTWSWPQKSHHRHWNLVYWSFIVNKNLPARAMFLNSAYNRLRSRVGHLRRWWYCTSTDPLPLCVKLIFSKRKRMLISRLTSLAFGLLWSRMIRLTRVTLPRSACSSSRVVSGSCPNVYFGAEHSGMWVLVRRFTIGLLIMKISTKFGG